MKLKPITLLLGPCDPGYFCTGAAVKPTQFKCGPGKFSLAGASQETPCPIGRYNQEHGRSACLECPNGFYCPNVSTISYLDCPKGYYCNAGTSVPERCPVGRFSADTNLFNSTDCLTCPEGNYCSTPGATSPTGLCHERYFCIGGAISPKPTDGTTGNTCP